MIDPATQTQVIIVVIMMAVALGITSAYLTRRDSEIVFDSILGFVLLVGGGVLGYFTLALPTYAFGFVVTGFAFAVTRLFQN